MSLTGDRVVDVLERLRGTVGVPERIAIDNGPEFISKVLDAWAYRHAVCLEFSRPDKPTDNAFVESFNGHFRAECLDQHWFESVEEARQTIELWRVDYNTQRPHRSLQQQTPAAFVAAWTPVRSPRTNAFPDQSGGRSEPRTNVFPGPRSPYRRGCGWPPARRTPRPSSRCRFRRWSPDRVPRSAPEVMLTFKLDQILGPNHPQRLVKFTRAGAGRGYRGARHLTD